MSLRYEQIPEHWTMCPEMIGTPYWEALIRGVRNWRRYEEDTHRGSLLWGVSIDTDDPDYGPMYLTAGNPELDSHYEHFGTVPTELVIRIEDIIANPLDVHPSVTTHSTWSHA